MKYPLIFSPRTVLDAERGRCCRLWCLSLVPGLAKSPKCGKFLAMMRRWLLQTIVVVAVGAGCADVNPTSSAAPETTVPATTEADTAEPATNEADTTEPATAETATNEPETIVGQPNLPATNKSSFGPIPPSPDGPLDNDLKNDLDTLFASFTTRPDLEALDRIAVSGDPRTAWLLTDMMRFARDNALLKRTADAWSELTGVSIPTDEFPWGFATNHMIAWDIAAPPDYINWKRQLFERLDSRWAPLFDDPDAIVDWRWVSWGGVLIDDRPVDQTKRGCPQSCIPALNDPPLTNASEGSWYDDDAIIFGVVVNDEPVAFPKHIMEIHEMVNITIGGRRLGIPYCTLCGSAQAYFTDEVAAGMDLDGHETYELRTSGLLSRSNKLMFELHTKSVIDTFTGEAQSGPLRQAGVTLNQTSVRTSTWGDWKNAHPKTKIVAEDGGIGRSYPLDPLRGRDDDGPIFPIGDVDTRLAVQEPVVGVIADNGAAVAFPVAVIEPLTRNGASVSFGGVTISSDGAGYSAVADATNEPLSAHQAFWFAWSQFHPETLLYLN